MKTTYVYNPENGTLLREVKNGLQMISAMDALHEYYGKASTGGVL